jgi:hypothetical protein
MCLLQAINQNNEEQMKHFRLIVKQRLFEPLQVNFYIYLFSIKNEFVLNSLTNVVVFN